MPANKKVSSGILLYRKTNHGFEVLIAHPGGPFWQKKDLGVWSIPKGEVESGEDLLDAAKREFAEETGCVPAGPFIELKPITQKSGKQVHAWACEGDFEPASLKCNMFTMEWPPRSGKQKEFAEIDRVEWCSVEKAKEKMNPEQFKLVEELVQSMNKAN